MMKLPSYPKILDKTPIVVSVTESMSINGGPNIIATYNGKCCYNEHIKTVFTADGKRIQLVGKIYIGCDIAPEAKAIEGSVIIFGRTYKIYKGSRPRNPDGSVHHTELELM